MRIGVVGGGTMGRILARDIDESTDFVLAGVVDNQNSQDLNKLEELGEVDGIIDFSHPSYLGEVLEYCIKNTTPLLLATTGYSTQNISNIKEASKKIPLIFTGNTSMGINLLGEVVERVARSLGEDFDIEIIEKHHNKKLDSPSGTAKLLFNKVTSGLDRDVEEVNGRKGMRKRSKDEVGVHAIRGGTIVGEHSVIFAGEDEIIELKHEALSKRIFTRGSLKGIKYLEGKQAGFYKMTDVLGL